MPAWLATARNRAFRQRRGGSKLVLGVGAAFVVGLLLVFTGSWTVSRVSNAPPAGSAPHTPTTSPVQSAPAAESTPATPATPASGFRLVASGDVLPHTALVARAKAYGAHSGLAYDFRPMLNAIRPIVSAADLAVCHIETPLSPSGRHLSGYPVFNGPPQVAAALRETGYDACSTASNHSMDQGAQGVAGTLRVLDGAGLRHAGIARNPREAQPTLLTVKGVRVALLSYAYGLNGRRTPLGQPWRVNLIDPARILADARAARGAGSRFTVVFLHWGQEYRTAPTPAQLRVARQLLADPSIDLILGHHVHVVQPVRRIGGKWIAFGMGNLLSAQSTACCPAATQDGVLIQVNVVRRGNRYVVGDLRYTPTWVQHPGYQVRSVLQSLAHDRLDATTRAAMVASLHRTEAAIGPQAHPASG